MAFLIPNRRGLLKAGLAGLTLAAPLAGASAAFAQAPRAQGRKFMVIILRGALDGLAAVAPQADPRHEALRGRLAYQNGMSLRDGFSLHPALAGLGALWNDGALKIAHAIASPYRERSHFDGQDVLESGGGAVGAVRDGWLNRALQLMGADAPGAVGVGPAIPLILRGAAEASSWAPAVLPSADEATIFRLMDLYQHDAVLADALSAAIATDAAADGMAEMENTRPPLGGAGPNAYAQIAGSAANLLAAPNGPDLGVLSLDGWDTHVNQGAETGQLALRLAGLDAAVSAVKTRLGAHWDTTAVLVITEFGRTVRINGANGTDHGTGGCAFLTGGAVAGSGFVGDWPGLDRLYEDRDLYPANDLRSLLKGVLSEHWGLDRADLDRTVFPDSAQAAAFSGLVG